VKVRREMEALFAGATDARTDQRRQ
jgi:hypothetical protein